MIGEIWKHEKCTCRQTWNEEELSLNGANENFMDFSFFLSALELACSLAPNDDSDAIVLEINAWMREEEVSEKLPDELKFSWIQK